MTKSAIPVWMMAIYAGFRIRTSVDSPLMCWLFWITLVFFSLTYTEITAGRRRYAVWLLLPVVLVPLAVIVYDRRAALLALIPSMVMKFVVWLLKLLDYFGLLPAFLLELSPFHGSLFFTSMGSLGIRPIYHHLYDFGNLPVFGAFGCKRRAYEVQEDGSVVQRKYIDVKFTLDERIVDGYCYATFFKYFRHLIRNPELLDQPPEEVVHDIP